ncbi:regulatory protein [Streptomyces noursei ZPM]|uniref:Toxin n=1 Tax=Streptomyces noursei TaxID=1971 RepID=A0A401QY87_STRNR|nr:DUF397 domain-containing protein [Streptomyces noursei]AKA02987.1 regulatory protein [Streptomyces noursei ZPM]EXU89944.1 hypothetical protein P354_19400 [Streptomyces noursei PD-1]UWS71507.1 DUF397 domain-containing protein [Streptomyces noursei]GCB90332.1 toxin [Streptomyces noursei]
MSTPNLDAARWRKSTYSNGGDGNCVEVSDSFPSMVPVRDSKDPHGPALMFSADGWSSFVTAVKGGEFNH